MPPHAPALCSHTVDQRFKPELAPCVYRWLTRGSSPNLRQRLRVCVELTSDPSPGLRSTFVNMVSKSRLVGLNNPLRSTLGRGLAALAHHRIVLGTRPVGNLSTVGTVRFGLHRRSTIKPYKIRIPMHRCLFATPPKKTLASSKNAGIPGF